MNQKWIILACLFFGVVIPARLIACTIFCAKDQHGQVWAANNEDFYYFDFSTWIRVVPETDSTLAFLYFGYPDTVFPQGGVNAAGLFYDGNAVELTTQRSGNKIPFPEKGEHALLLFVLGHCKTVPEAIELFRKYQTPWMSAAQLNLADKKGNLGIITADSAWLSQGNFQVSTNYSLADNDDDYKRCWRYPIAHSMLSGTEPSFELLTKICDSTSQREGVSTIYSNVHNLTTGDMWFYYSWDYENPHKTTFDDMLALGDTMILFRDLFVHQTVTQAYNDFSKNGFAAGLAILDSIADPVVRAEKLMLLSQNALFSFDSYIESGELKITRDENLIREIIAANSSEEILSRIANQDISSRNKELVERKLATIKGSGINTNVVVGVVCATVILGLLMLLRSTRSRQHINKKL